MKTKKITQKTIKQLIKEGAATDLEKMRSPIPRHQLKCLGISTGIYGINGALYLGNNGKLYAIASRSSMLLEYE